MERTQSDKQTASTDQSDVKYYLPGMPRLSNDPGRVERFLKTLFRRRGAYRIVLRRAEQ